MAIFQPTQNVLQTGIDMTPSTPGPAGPYDPKAMSAQTGFGMMGTGLGLATGGFGLGTLGSLAGRAIDTNRANNYTQSLGLGRPASFFSWSSPGEQAIAAVNNEQTREANRGYAMGAGGFGLSPDSGGLGSDGSPGGPSGGSGGEGMGNGGNAWAEGGPVTHDRLTGPNPAGPDDGYGQLQAGEYVLRQQAANRLGPQVLDKINRGDFKTKALINALR